MDNNMRHRSNALIYLGLGICALMLCSAISAAPLSDRPNFIFILSDDQGWPHLSVEMTMGNTNSNSDYHQTPNLEKLAQEGMRFTSGYAPAAVCSPTRYSIQYGQTPARLRMTRVGIPTDHIDHNMLSIPKLLKSIDSNYKAAHFGKFHLDVDPSVLGYDQSDGATKNSDGDVGSQGNRWGPNVFEDPKLIFSITERANNFMQQQVDANNPFFLQISHYATHADVISRQTTLNKYNQLPKGTIHDHPPFAAMTEDMDTGIGMVMDKIKELGIEDNTYVIFTSDNGGMASMPKNNNYTVSYNYPLQRGKFDLTEGGIRVPFIVRGPGITPNSQSDVPVIGYDLLPTIADLAGYTGSLPENIDGGSFKDVLLNNGQGSVARGWEGLIFHFPHTHGQNLDDYGSAIRVGDYKLLKFRKEHSPTLMFFDLKNDIGETTNLASLMPEEARDLDILLDDYLVKVGASIPFHDNDTTPGDHFIESSGQVVMEAENYDQSNINGDTGGEWNNDPRPPRGAVGNSMESPNAATASWSNGAELVYNIKFSSTGNYNVWLRRWANRGARNSCFKGYDGGHVGGTVDNGSTSSNWVLD